MNTTQPAGLNKTYVDFKNLRDEPKLLIDDTRTPEQVFEMTKEEVYSYPNWTIVRDYYEFMEYITQNPMPKVVSFDHDLGGVDDRVLSVDGELEQQEAWDNYHNNPYRKESGYDCMKWLVEYCFNKQLVFPRILIHTQNPIGYDNIKYYYRNAIKHKMIKLR